MRTIGLVIAVIATTAGSARGQGDITFDPSLGVDLSVMTRSPLGVYSKVLIEGQGARATVGTSLRVEFTSLLPDGSQFSATPDGEPLEFVLDSRMMIPGFIDGVTGMRPGESRLIVVPPELGYGDQGVPGKVPPGSTLIFRIRRISGLLPVTWRLVSTRAVPEQAHPSHNTRKQ